jgi:hypothetical protein
MNSCKLNLNIITLSMVLSLLLLFPPYTLWAQNATNSKENSIDVLRKMGSAIDNIGASKLKFVVNAEIDAAGKSVSSADNYFGSVEVEGSSFKMVSPDFEIFCDGVSKWILNVASDELTIFPNDTTQTDMVENPVGFLRSLASGKDNGYKHSQRATLSSDGNLWQVELTPSGRGSLCKNLIISVNRNDYLPFSIVYNGTDGSGYRVEVTSFMKVDKWEAGNFIFPESRKKGLHITDLR